MALKIIRAYEPMLVEHIITTIYGGPGRRKTTIACTAEAPLVLDFDEGAYRAPNRGEVAVIPTWMDAVRMDAADFAGYKTAVVDTGGKALDKLALHVMAEDPKNRTRGGSPSLQGFGEMKGAFATWLSRLKSFGLDIVIVTHMTEEKKGDDVIERLDVQGASRALIHQNSDAMGRVYLDEENQTTLNFSPTAAAYGKNPAMLGPLVFRDHVKDPRFLADIIGQIKTTLNSESETIREMREKLELARGVYEKLETPEAFTEQAENLAKIGAEPVIKSLLLQTAGAKGFAFDREKKAFVVKTAPAQDPAPTTGSAPPPAPNGTGPAPAPRTSNRGGRSSGNRRQA